jgi:Membrane protease subunits, stomatin/prohibitin homologs
MDSSILFTIVTCLIAALLIPFFYKKFVYKVIVFQYQKGLLYQNGVFQTILEPGAYRLFRPSSTVSLIDTRTASITIGGQEIITADNVGLKLSLQLSYQLVDPVVATHSVQTWYTEIYTMAQLAARDVLSALKVDEIVQGKAGISEKIVEIVKPKALSIGVSVSQVEIKDLMFPADLKKRMPI